jgi:hypothetical protein
VAPIQQNPFFCYYYFFFFSLLYAVKEYLQCSEMCVEQLGNRRDYIRLLLVDLVYFIIASCTESREGWKAIK